MRRLRDAVYALLHAVRRARVPAQGAVALVNSFAAYPAPRPQLAAHGPTVTWHSDDPVRAALAVLARDAIDLVSGADLAGFANAPLRNAGCCSWTARWSGCGDGRLEEGRGHRTGSGRRHR